MNCMSVHAPSCTPDEEREAAVLMKKVISNSPGQKQELYILLQEEQLAYSM